MTTPSQARIDAALRLAEAVFRASRNGVQLIGHEEDIQEVCKEARAYRATLPKLRTRAEVDAEIATIIREWIPHRQVSTEFPGHQRMIVLSRLITEPTAPEPDY